jgi:hypothetical protein
MRIILQQVAAEEAGHENDGWSRYRAYGSENKRVPAALGGVAFGFTSTGLLAFFLTLPLLFRIVGLPLLSLLSLKVIPQASHAYATLEMSV